MGRHHAADQLVDLAAVIPTPRVSPEFPEAPALRSTPFPAVPAPRRAPEATPAPVAVPQPRGWRARRAAKADAATARAQAVALAHAERRARQVALASLAG
ncbi:hypothetical protein [Actinomycetospora termitidis]|uniref:Uncharacterized protein n=1 Tax=Actinomycetospora termitidis TaxID=3053470 RepID=A0ABT7M2U6_9PSEU|nr:hypothetical protein [Actinomycetospora sp. Odt1-22]MDL5154751.1 hypothetical protein [Actinomycetospora sp. Odt1-22]